VHRLDRDTSGLLVVARSEEAHRRLKDLIGSRLVEREYLALVLGRPPARTGTIDAPIGRDRRDRIRNSTDTDTPREARTHFAIERALPETTLLRVRLETGRTHQIRVHLEAIGHPVVGDPEYRWAHGEAPYGLQRQFLHAARLAFTQPVHRGGGRRLLAAARRPGGGAGAGRGGRLGHLRTLAVNLSVSSTPRDGPTASCPASSRRVPAAHLRASAQLSDPKEQDHMPEVGIRELLESGVHFGHQTRRWNRRCAGSSSVSATASTSSTSSRRSACCATPRSFASPVASRGGTVLFVGTKKQARDAVKESAEAPGMPYVNHRWLGGLLTNFQTISQRIKRLHDLERYEREGQLELLPTRERMAAKADLEKLRANLGGVKNMQRVPQAMFVIDLKTELIAVREAQRLRIPIIGLVDTNCDPDGIDYVVPGNDDAIRSCALISRAIGEVVQEGTSGFREAEEERMRKEGEEQARREAEAKAKREAEETARHEAEMAEARRRDTLVHAEGGGDRQVAEAEVAEAVQAGGRPLADPIVARRPTRTSPRPTRPGPATSPRPSRRPPPRPTARSSTPTSRSTPRPRPRARRGGPHPQRRRPRRPREHRLVQPLRAGREGPARAHRRGMMDCKKALTESAATSTRPSRSCARSRASASRTAASASRPRAPSRPTSTRTPRSAC
jgi:small subunit ribosomal protein S2